MAQTALCELDVLIRVPDTRLFTCVSTTTGRKNSNSWSRYNVSLKLFSWIQGLSGPGRCWSLAEGMSMVSIPTEINSKCNCVVWCELCFQRLSADCVSSPLRTNISEVLQLQRASACTLMGTLASRCNVVFRTLSKRYRILSFDILIDQQIPIPCYIPGMQLRDD